MIGGVVEVFVRVAASVCHLRGSCRSGGGGSNQMLLLVQLQRLPPDSCGSHSLLLNSCLGEGRGRRCSGDASDLHSAAGMNDGGRLLLVSYDVAVADRNRGD